MWTGTHQADFLGGLAVTQAQAAVANNKPFYVQVNPVMVHWGTCDGPHPPGTYAPDDPHWEWTLPGPCTKAGVCALPMSPCPTLRRKHAADGLTNPHVPSYNLTASGDVPNFIQHFGPILPFVENRQNMGFRNRTASAGDLDDMIGVIMAGLEQLGVLNETYVIFSSDNGFA